MGARPRAVERIGVAGGIRSRTLGGSDADREGAARPAVPALGSSHDLREGTEPAGPGGD
ncbi:hypothetical protein GCM10022282_25860 [Agromyces indicus]